jgi:hypothetical protein
VRLAGVYEMARLADDWADQRQTCVDVLCACLRTEMLSTGQTEAAGQLFIAMNLRVVVGETLSR